MRPALAGLLMAVSAADAQPGDELTQRLRRLDSLVVVRLEELRARDRTEVAERRMRAIEVDGVRLLTDSAVASWAVEGFRQGWRDVRTRGKDWVDRIATDLDLRILVDGSSPPDARALSIEAYDLENPALTASEPVFRRDAVGMRHATTALFERLLQNTLDVEFKGWLTPAALGTNIHAFHISLTEDNSLFGAVDASAPIWREVRMHAVRTPSAASRECLAGSARACATAMGINVVPRPPLATWYSPADYRWLSGHVSPEGDSLRRADWVACDRGAAGACERFVAATPPGLADPPLALADARRPLLAIALELGGPNAVDRLLASTGPIPDRLARVAGVPFDSLLATWQSRVAAADPVQSREHPIALITGLLGALALLTMPRRRT